MDWSRFLYSLLLLFQIFFQSCVAKSRSNARRHSGRLLGRPNTIKCARRPRSLLSKDNGHYYFFSVDTKYKGAEATWLDSRNLCREQCMDLVSIETSSENQMIIDLILQRNLRDAWTSGRLCNFNGCNQPHLQPRHINGWFWSGTGVSIASTNSTPAGWSANPWSRTGFIGQFLAHDVPQPDNAEYLLNPSLATVEACLAINNNWYGDGVAWHDTACYRKKPFICEDSDVLMRRARALNPQIFA